jgi:hypothetical protein
VITDEEPMPPRGNQAKRYSSRDMQFFRCSWKSLGSNPGVSRFSFLSSRMCLGHWRQAAFGESEACEKTTKTRAKEYEAVGNARLFCFGVCAAAWSFVLEKSMKG